MATLSVVVAVLAAVEAGAAVDNCCCRGCGRRLAVHCLTCGRCFGRGGLMNEQLDDRVFDVVLEAFDIVR